MTFLLKLRFKYFYAAVEGAAGALTFQSADSPDETLVLQLEPRALVDHLLWAYLVHQEQNLTELP
jgi:hypothetical protein